MSSSSTTLTTLFAKDRPIVSEGFYYFTISSTRTVLSMVAITVVTVWFLCSVLFCYEAAAWQQNQSPQVLHLDACQLSRRRLFVSTFGFALLNEAFPSVAAAAADRVLDPRAIVTIQLESKDDRLGLQLSNTSLRGKPIVVIQQISSPNKTNKPLQPGMILLNFESAKDVVDRIQSGPFPLELKFFNLAAGGDAFNDMGQPMVTAQDALDLARQTDEPNKSSSTSPGSGRRDQEEYSITILNDGGGAACAIQTRKGDLLEIEYEATALISDSPSLPSRRVVYDASFMRGTGLPYQMVLGSGDMLPGVDQGLYDMCPGQERLVKIPPPLAYGGRGNKLFRIPPDTPLEWKIKLVTIDATIREDNNDQTRDEREGRALYSY